MKVIEYPIESTNSNLANITLVNRYPENGYALNTESEMMVYVLKGETILNCNDTEHFLKEGAVSLIKKNQNYFWEPTPEVTLLIFSTPPWNKEQQRIN